MIIESAARSTGLGGGYYQIVIGLVQPAQAMSCYLEMLSCKEDFYQICGGRLIDLTEKGIQTRFVYGLSTTYLVVIDGHTGCIKEVLGIKSRRQCVFLYMYLCSSPVNFLRVDGGRYTASD